MSESNKWIDLLNQVGVEVNYPLNEGKITNVLVNQEKETWRIFVNLPVALNYSDLNKVMNQVNDYFTLQTGVKHVFFTFSLDCNTCSDELLLEYFDEGIIQCANVKKSLLLLQSYKHVAKNGRIQFFTSSTQEEAIIKKCANTILKFLNNYGLSEVVCEIVIDDELTNPLEAKQQENKRMQQQDEARALEEYHFKQASSVASSNLTKIPLYRSKDTLQIAISDVPSTSMEVESFKQVNGTNKVNIIGTLDSHELKNLKSKKTGKEYHLFQGIITDTKDSIVIKRFYKDFEQELFEHDIKDKERISISGTIQWDDFLKDVAIMCDRLVLCGEDCSRKRFDEAAEHRVELHAHTKMSVMDSILNVDEYVLQAARFHHKALAVCDHANCHVLPEFFQLAHKQGLKPIAGVEAYYVDDTNLKIAYSEEDIPLNNTTYVVFDLETTGFCINFNEIIEIGAVKIKNGIVLDQFCEFIHPKDAIGKTITDITGITNEMVSDASNIEDILPKFVNFIQGSVLVGHNVSFDLDYLYENMKRQKLFNKPFPAIDTMNLAKVLYGNKGLKRFNLSAVAKYLKAEVEQQHRAVHDARTTYNVFSKMLGDLSDLGIKNYKDINTIINPEKLFKYVIPRHINLLVKNKTPGLKNFYKIITDSHTTHLQKDATLLKTVLVNNREGLLVGSGCCNGEIWRLAFEKTKDELLEAMAFYDYIEVQPPIEYEFLIEDWPDIEKGRAYIKDCIKEIIGCAKELNKTIVATGDVHELLLEDSEYREIYINVPRLNGLPQHDLVRYKTVPDMHFRNTSEMLEAFGFLKKDLAYEIVVTNTCKIADSIEDFNLFPDKLFVPEDDTFKDLLGVPSMKQAVQDISYNKAKSLYGDNLPQYVKERLDKELSAIIGHGFFSVYYISHLLVKDSNDHGYVVGSRGSVGSSVVAYFMDITEVNALKPHYLCPKCHRSYFKFNNEEKKLYNVLIPEDIDKELQKVHVGMDLKEMECEYCHCPMERLGINIAFETFLGFQGEKVPDIDLNFSSEYQPQAHLFIQKTFGVDKAFRAGTITTVMDKTAFAYARDYYAKMKIVKRQCDLDRIAKFIAGSKKTTGQHPGGIVVVPEYIDYTDLIPVQFPPVSKDVNIEDLSWRTSHYDYHSFSDNLLKFDILGHDDPTIIKDLMDYVHERQSEFTFTTVDEIPYVDKEVISLFSSKESLHIMGEDDDALSSGTIGVPEFGTKFVRGMLETIKPKTYNDIIKISGLAHGTDVWAGNAESLFLGNVKDYDFPKVPFLDVIGCRDDIMIYLINHSVPSHDAFTIMEAVRKGKGLKPAQEKLMNDSLVPEWFIWSCKKIKYLFPKAHATAYVIMALRIAWFKVHKPIYYYAVYFSVRAKALDAEAFANGKNAIKNRIKEIEKKQNLKEEVTKKELDLYDTLKIALEMVLRGYQFRQINLLKSEAIKFVIAEDSKSLYLPFSAVDSLGEAVAFSVVEARNKQPFTSKRDLQQRTSLNKTQLAKLELLGVFEDLPEEDKLF